MNTADITITKNEKYQKLKSHKLTTRSKVGTGLGCFVGNL